MNPKTKQFRHVEHNSSDYWKLVSLRNRLLRVPLGLEFSESELNGESDHHHLGIFLDEKVIACLVLVPLLENRIKMRQVVVEENFQGLGLGKALVEWSEAFSLELGFDHMLLNARLNAVPFYEKLDYHTMGQEFMEVGIPHYQMQKPLVPQSNDL